MAISPAQCRLGREALGWSLDDLAEKSKVSRKTIYRFENGAITPFERTLRDVESALEAGGVVFIPEKEGEYLATSSLRWGMDDPKLKKTVVSKEVVHGCIAETNSNVDQALIDHWAGRPKVWDELPDVCKEALTTLMYGQDNRELGKEVE